jgi:hypothetical protein
LDVAALIEKSRSSRQILHICRSKGRFVNTHRDTIKRLNQLGKHNYVAVAVLKNTQFKVKTNNITLDCYNTHSDPLIIDIYDNWSIFSKYIYPRLRYYKSQKWSIEPTDNQKFEKLKLKNGRNKKPKVGISANEEIDCPF